MRDLIVIEYLSVDGVAQAPGHSGEDPDDGFTAGGWTQPFHADHSAYMQEALNVMGALLLGRLTFEIWAPYWPTVTDPADENARMLNSVPKHVASTTLPDSATSSWPGTSLIRDVATEVGALKEAPGKAIVVMGSTRLVQSLTALDLVDEYRLMVHPVMLGVGKRVFDPAGPTQPLTLTNTSTTRSGLAILTYRRNRATS